MTRVLAAILEGIDAPAVEASRIDSRGGIRHRMHESITIPY